MANVKKRSDGRPGKSGERPRNPYAGRPGRSTSAGAAAAEDAPKKNHGSAKRVPLDSSFRSVQDKKARRVQEEQPRRAASGRDARVRAPKESAAPVFELRGPGAVVSRRAADRLRAGHVWVYASDIEQVKAGSEPLLTVVDGRGIPLGSALYSDASQIALRMVSHEVLRGQSEWLKILDERLRAAIARRTVERCDTQADTNAMRLAFSEGDALPGLIIDRYADLVIVQLLAQGTYRDDVRENVVRVLCEELQPATIVERPDPRIRELEKLSAPSLEPLFVREGGEPVLQTQFRLNGLIFHYDSSAGQKTGAFLDQARNYAVAERYARGEALDVCTYQGGFALHMGRKCSKVTGVDVSRAALEVAERNLEANHGQMAGEVDWIEANAFELMREWSDAGMQFDTIVLDPPAFAKTKRAAESAVRGYKELTLRAFRMLRPGGVLLTCSCSHHVSLAEFTQATAAAAVDAGRTVQLLERRGAAPDHPHVINIPETEYLKCLVCRVE